MKHETVYKIQYARGEGAFRTVASASSVARAMVEYDQVICERCTKKRLAAYVDNGRRLGSVIEREYR